MSSEKPYEHDPMTSVFSPVRDAWLAFRHSSNAAMILDLDSPTWTVLEINDAFQEATLQNREHLIGKGLFEIFQENDETSRDYGYIEIAHALEAATAGQRMVLPLQRYDIPDPETAGAFVERYWQLTSSPVWNAAGEVVALLHEAQDVTVRERSMAEQSRHSAAADEQNRRLAAQAEELQRASRELQERKKEAETQRERAENILETMADAQYVLDSEFRFVSLNTAMARAVNLSREQLIGQSLWKLFPGIGDTERYYREAAAGTAAHFVHEYSDGRLTISAEVDVYPSTGGGVAVFWRDITARVDAEARLRESETQLRTMVDALPTLAWTARADGYIDWYNEQWYIYTGSRREDMEGWGWQSVHDPARLSAVMAEWTRCIDSGAKFEMTFPLLGGDGKFRPFLTRVAPLHNADGAVVRWFGTNTNIEHEHAARRLAEEANESKTTFLATMSHELRTPLNAIGGYLDLLLMELRGPLNDMQRTDLERIRRSHQRLSGLINDVLHFAKIDSGHTAFEITSVDIGAAIRQVEEVVSLQCTAKDLACDFELPQSRILVSADGDRLGQILLNLLTNAVKYTPPGGSIVTTCDTINGDAVVRIADTGDGIAEAQLQTIFDPFVQVGRRLNAPGEGVGLGLSISRALAEGMNGSLSVESQVGKGSVFTLTLPLAQSSR